jgi:hypothetical protein
MRNGGWRCAAVVRSSQLAIVGSSARAERWI